MNAKDLENVDLNDNAHQELRLGLAVINVRTLAVHLRLLLPRVVKVFSALLV